MGNLSAFRAEVAHADDRWRDMAERVAADPDSRVRLDQRRRWALAAMAKTWKAAKLAAVLGIEHPPRRSSATRRAADRAARFHRPADAFDRAAREEGRRIEVEREAERRGAEARLAIGGTPVPIPQDPRELGKKPRWLVTRSQPESKHIDPLCAGEPKSPCPEMEDWPF